LGVIASIFGAIVVCLLIYLIFSGIYFEITTHEVPNPTLNLGSNSSSIATLPGSNETLSSPTNASLAAYTGDNMSLAQLEMLSFNSTDCGGKQDPSYWDTVFKASGNATVHIIPNTVYSFTQSVGKWTALYQQEMSNPPSWLSLGLQNYTQSFVPQLAAKILGAKNASAAGAVLRNVTATAAGLSLAGVDQITLEAISGLDTYISTKDAGQAAAATLPGQIYQVFSLSQDCSFSEQQRATFLGEGLAMVALITATSGKDGFAPKFDALLSSLHLLDVWSSIKGYLGDIDAVSPTSAYETTMVLQEMSQRFPVTFDSVAPFTADRIDLMVLALKDKGFTADEINAKLSELAQFAKTASGGGDVAERADEISYEETGQIVVRVDNSNHLILYGGTDTTNYIQETFLQKEVPGFVGTQDMAFKITLHKEGDATIFYYVYQGGQSFGPTLPKGLGEPGDVIPISIETLPLDAFLKAMPAFQLENSAYLSWVSDSVVVRDMSVQGDTIRIHITQDNPFSSTEDFTLSGTVQTYPGSSTNYGGAYVQFTVSDYIGGATTLRLRSDGYDMPQFQVVLSNGQPYAVSLISYDGLRLSVVYSSDNKVTTTYLVPPSTDIYALGDMQPYSGDYLSLIKGSYTNAYTINQVETLRGEETAMLSLGSPYVVGRLGAEIAYVVATDKLGLTEVVLQEPSVGGRDLYTQDNTVAIQARLLVNINPSRLDMTIQNQLLDLVDKLKQDYQHQDAMVDGYAVLSYVDPNGGGLKTIVVEVPRP